MNELFDLKLLQEVHDTTNAGKNLEEKNIKASSEKNLLDVSLKDILQTEKSEADIKVYQVKDSNKLQLLKIKVSIFHDGDHMKRTLIQMIDITSNLMYNNQVTENKTIGMLNSTVSHELRNPLNSLKSYNLEKKAILKDVKEYLDNEDINKEMLVKNLKNVHKKLSHN